TLIERWPQLGGVCLNVGCIPSKTLLHAARVLDEARAMAAHGIEFGEPRIDFARLRGWKNKVVQRLTGGLSTLARQRKVGVLRGTARFISGRQLELTDADGVKRTLEFKQCIIAAGSEPARLSGLPD